MSHYVDNDKFYAEMLKRRELVLKAKEEGNPLPRISEYIGECIYKIATHLSYKYNFINYSFKDEMIADGIENCLQYIDSFDPERGTNPFAYFTQIIFYAFIRRIQTEKKQSLIKGRIIQEMPFDLHDLQEQDETGEYVNSFHEFLKTNGMYADLVSEHEKKLKQKKIVNKPSALDDLFE